MARTDTLPHFLTDVADAIRGKTGSSETIQASSFDTAISNIPSGTTIEDVSTEANMNSLAIENNLGKMYNYIGTPGKYINAMYKVCETVNNDLVVLNNSWFCIAGSVSTYTQSINCSIGSKLIAFVTFRNDTYTLSSGWTEIGKSDKTYEQFMVIATKTAESTTESITATQGASARMYINILELPSTATISLDGFQYESSSVANKTITNQSGLKMYGLSAYFWNSSSVIYPWVANSDKLQYYGLQTSSSIQQRQGVFVGYLDENTDITFYPSWGSASSTIILASLSISGISKSYYMEVYNKNVLYNNYRTLDTTLSCLLNYIPFVRVQAGGSTAKIFNYFITAKHIDIIAVYGYGDMSELCQGLTLLEYIGKILYSDNITSFANAFRDCASLEHLPMFNTSSVTNMSNIITGCPNLTDESLDNVLQMAINSNVSSGKTWKSLCSNNYSLEKISALPHYQDFLNAGWTYE